jgi:hypothetical protein
VPAIKLMWTSARRRTPVWRVSTIVIRGSLGTGVAVLAARCGLAGGRDGHPVVEAELDLLEREGILISTPVPWSWSQSCYSPNPSARL